MKKIIFALMSVSFLPTAMSVEPTPLAYTYIDNPQTDKLILFVHGTPGSQSAYRDYLNSALIKSSSLLVVDRLGFGGSNLKAESSLVRHSESIEALINEKFKDKKISCVGHSYGSTLCLKILSRNSNTIKSGVLIAGAFNPNRKILRWYNRLGNNWPAKWFLSRSLKNSNHEMYGLKKELKILLKEINKVKQRVTLIHGDKDGIVPFEDSVWLYSKIKEQNPKNKFIQLKKEGHFILWSKQGLIEKAILENIDF